MAHQCDQLIKPQTRNGTSVWPTYKAPNKKWHISVTNWCSPKQGMTHQGDQLLKSITRNGTYIRVANSCSLKRMRLNSNVRLKKRYFSFLPELSRYHSLQLRLLNKSCFFLSYIFSNCFPEAHLFYFYLVKTDP